MNKRSIENQFILFYNGFLSVFAGLSFIWLRSSWEKLSHGRFPDTLADTLVKFASHNPYPWYKQFLISTAIPHAYLFGILTQWGELAVAVSLVVSVLFLFRFPLNSVCITLFSIACIGGMFLNTIFWLASGYLSPAGDSINLLMFMMESIGLTVMIMVWRKSKSIQT